MTSRGLRSERWDKMAHLHRSAFVSSRSRSEQSSQVLNGIPSEMTLAHAFDYAVTETWIVSLDLPRTSGALGKRVLR
jgi:hypothetical protein